jgi:hypothetical protein
MTLAQLVQVAQIAGGAIALATLVKIVLEYSRQNALKRAEYFFILDKKIVENPIYLKICGLLDTDDRALADVPYEEKLTFLGLFEQVALSMNSGLISVKVAHYMFSYYAIRCLDSRHFWEKLQEDKDYWKLFHSFATRMKQREIDLQAHGGLKYPSSLKF